jgi:tRNA pseudouridine13 synthase
VADRHPPTSTEPDAAEDVASDPASSAPRIRARPEDFVVHELPLYEPIGEGRHLFVHVEKRLRTTEEIARQLARATGVAQRDVGYAGRKDRVAVARQWFSLPEVTAEAVAACKLDGAVVLAAANHPHKLRTGHLRANRFEIRVRNVTEAVEGRAREALSEMLRVGMPNRYGAQRFGRDGRNVEQARALLAGGRTRKGRREARFMISALQSAVFNLVLARRPVPLDVLEPGDVAQLVDSHGLFVVEDEAAENARAARFEISATGPIFGTKMMQPIGAVARREAEAMAELGVPDLDSLQPPRGVRLRGTRRAVRVPLQEPSLEREGDALLVRVVLPAGSYATVLLEELLGELAEGRA